MKYGTHEKCIQSIDYRYLLIFSASRTDNRTKLETLSNKNMEEKKN